MKLYIIAVSLITICLVQSVPSSDTSPYVIKRVDCGQYCWTLTCLNVESCPAKQALIPADGDCYCCNGCENIIFRGRCDPRRCRLVDCNPEITPKYCAERNMAFAKRDGKCLCCDACIKMKPRCNNP